jgi:peptidyl-prolyl cis-trans isomerase SurA
MFQEGRTSLTQEERTGLFNRILEELINDKLVIAQARRLDIEVSFGEVEGRVNEAIEEYRKALGGEEQFNRQLEREGFTLERLKKLYRDQLRNRMLVERVLAMEVDRREIDVSDAALRRFYEEKKAELPERPPVVHLKTIFIGVTASEAIRAEAQAKIEEIRRRIVGGEPFADLARQYSDDTSAPLGGDMGFVSPNDLADPALSAAVAKLAVGEVTEPVLTTWGYHLIQVTERKAETGEIRAWHILVRAVASEEDIQRSFAEATRIHGQIVGGASFADLAREYSTDPSASEGGDLGWLRVNELPEFFREVLGGMNPGDMSQVLRESNGFRIVNLVEKEAGRPYQFDEIRDEIRRLYEQDKLTSAYAKYVEGLKDKFTVVVYDKSTQ